MRKIIYILSLCLTIFVSCDNDDAYPIETNQYGSTKEVTEDYILSGYTLSNEKLKIQELSDCLTHHLISQSDNQLYQFEGKILEVGDLLRCQMQIPLQTSIPDGNYTLYFTNKDELRLPIAFILEMKNDMVAAVYEENVDYSMLPGSGTAEDPYIVEDLGRFFYLLNIDNTHASGLYFRQKKDIKELPMQGEDLEGRGMVGQIFAGHYDGSGYELGGLVHNGTYNAEKDSTIGFFKELKDGAVVENVKFTRVSVRGVSSYAGTLAAKAQGNVTARNITISGFLEGEENIGGLIGRAENATLALSDISMDISVKATSQAGGLVGSASQTELSVKAIRHTNTYKVEGVDLVGGIIGELSDGTILADDIKFDYTADKEDEDIAILKGTGNYLGAIVGKLQLRDNKSEIRSLYMELPIYGHSRVGGLFGSVDTQKASGEADILLTKITIKGCRISSDDNEIGGIAGYWNKAGITVDNLETKAIITGKKYVGGLIGHIGSVAWEKNAFNAVYMEPTNKTSGSEYVGGVFGSIDNGEEKEFLLNASTFAFKNLMEVTGTLNVGGFAGYASNCIFTGDIDFDKDIKNTSEIKGKPFFSGKINENFNDAGSAHHVGGLFGYLIDCKVSHLMTDGVVVGGERVAGIAGYGGNTSFSHCVRMGQPITASQDNVGGICGKLMNKVKKDQYLLVNFSTITGAKQAGGIFGYVETDKDITIEHAINRGPVTGGQSTGGVIAKIHTQQKGHDNEDKVQVIRCANYGEIKGNYNGGEVLRGLGGIAGQVEYCVDVSQCANHGDITAPSGKTYNGVGGIVGVLGHDGTVQSEDNNVVVHHSCNTGIITTEMGTGDKKWTIGGIVGRIYFGWPHDSHSARVHNCYNRGAIKGNSKEDNGGIVGTVENYGQVNECLNLATVKHGNGGVGTHAGASFYITNIYYLKIEGDVDTKGWKATSFKESEKKNKSTFNFTFNDSYWTIDYDDKNDGYPYIVNCYYQFMKD